MSAIRLLQAERHEDIQHLHRQLMTGGLLQKELLEEAEGYLIQKGIYDVTLIEECDFREYKKLLIDSGRYTRQSAVERSSALRKNQRYWVEQEYGELLAEIKECQVSDAPLKGNIQRFLIRQGIHHIKDIDYTTRSRYEAELQKTGNEQRVMKYLKVFDLIKACREWQETGCSIKRRLFSCLTCRIRNWSKILNMFRISRNWCGILQRERRRN